MPTSQFKTFFISVINKKKHEETVDHKIARKRSGTLTKMLRSAAAVLEQTLSVRICMGGTHFWL